jgi:uncharacterized protein YjbI with pentapeptide repeats
MANQEHLDILLQGVQTWNQWRKEHPQIHPDLSYANLHNEYLGGADLRETNLSGAILREANLTEADLSGANLSGVDLSFAHPFRANLSGAVRREVASVIVP